MSECVIFNGELMDSSVIPIAGDCHGMAYGHGVFETIRVLSGRPCFFDEHYARLSGSATALGLDLVWSKSELKEQCLRLARESELVNGGLKLLCFLGQERTEVLIHLRNVVQGAVDGMSMCLSKVVKSSEAISVRHKTLNYLENFLQLKAAREEEFDECIFVNEHGFITECCTANLFFIVDGVLKTPSLDCGLLDGVVRGRIIDMAKNFGIAVDEGQYGVDDLKSATEVFTTNSLRGISLVNRIQLSDSKKISYKGPMGMILALQLADLERKSVDG